MDDPVDVFVSHHQKDRAQALALVAELERRGLIVWVAGRDEVPGRSRQDQQESALTTAPVIAVFVGAWGREPWTTVHLRAGLLRLVDDDAFVIPVFLRDAPEEVKLPSFLQDLVAVDMRLPDHDEEYLARSIRAACSREPSLPVADGGDVIAGWLAQVKDEHRRLADHFERPVELRDVERAWVCLELELDDAENRPSGKFFGHRPLDEFLALSREAYPWATGRWLVEGDPGAGKTTLLRHLAGRFARRGKRERIPVFVSLPRLVESSAVRSLLRYLNDEYGELVGESLCDALDQAGKDGRLIVLLDGYDEVPPNRRGRAWRLLGKLVRDWPQSCFVVASRPIGLGEPPEVFTKLILQPLDEVQRRNFLEKWFRHRGLSEPETEANSAACHFDAERSLRELSRNPLHLTLLTVLWETGVKAPRRRSELYDEIFKLLLHGRHKTPPVAVHAIADVHEALIRLAYALTVEDVLAEAPERLEQRLRVPQLAELRGRLETVWGADLSGFLNEVHERTYILGPHDGRHAGWRFWHRTFREALTAEHLAAIHAEEGEAAVLNLVETIDEDLGRWAEPFALLAGRLAEADTLVKRLVEMNRPLGLRALATAQGLRPATLRAVLALTDDWTERRQVFEDLVDQVGEPDACLALIDQLRGLTRDGNDLLFLDATTRAVVRRWPSHRGRADDLLRRFFDHLPPPPEELFRQVATRDGVVPFWSPIPAGKFRMGSFEGQGLQDEPPQQVTVTVGFQMATVPVTNAQYASFDPAYEDAVPHYPVVQVTWFAAMAFCRWLGTAFPGVRLPTEEEWEYAARAGVTTRYWSGDNEPDLERVGWYHKNSGGRLHSVGEKSANPWGLYDVHGNVWEWTLSEKRDVYARRAAGIEHDPATVLPRVDNNSARVIRGGNFRNDALGVSVTSRTRFPPAIGSDGLGFRVVLPGRREPRDA